MRKLMITMVLCAAPGLSHAAGPVLWFAPNPPAPTTHAWSHFDPAMGTLYCVVEQMPGLEPSLYTRNGGTFPNPQATCMADAIAHDIHTQ